MRRWNRPVLRVSGSYGRPMSGRLGPFDVIVAVTHMMVQTSPSLHIAADGRWCRSGLHVGRWVRSGMLASGPRGRAEDG